MSRLRKCKEVERLEEEQWSSGSKRIKENMKENCEMILPNREVSFCRYAHVDLLMPSIQQRDTQIEKSRRNTTQLTYACKEMGMADSIDCSY